MSFGPNGTTYFTNDGTGKIGAWNFDSNAMWNGINSMDGGQAGVYLGSAGIALGNYFSVTNTGTLTAMSGTIGCLKIANNDYDKLYTGDHANWNSETEGIYIDADMMVFGPYSTGIVFRKSGIGKIGNWNISAKAFWNTYSEKGSQGATGEGVYLGTDGIALGNGQFIVNQDGSMYAANATLGGSLKTGDGTSQLFDITFKTVMGVTSTTITNRGQSSEVDSYCYLRARGLASMTKDMKVTDPKAYRGQIIPGIFTDLRTPNKPVDYNGWYMTQCLYSDKIFCSAGEVIGAETFYGTTNRLEGMINNCVTSSDLEDYYTKAQTESYVKTINTPSTGITGVSGCKCNRIATLYISSTLSAATGAKSGVVFGTLAKDYWPYKTIDFKSSMNDMRVWIQSEDGKIVLKSDNKTGDSCPIRGTFTFITRY